MGHIRIALWVSGSSGSTSITHFQPCCLGPEVGIKVGINHTIDRCFDTTLVMVTMIEFLVIVGLSLEWCMQWYWLVTGGKCDCVVAYIVLHS